MIFSIQEFLSKCDQIHRKLRIGSHLLKYFLMDNFIFCAVKFMGFFFAMLLHFSQSLYPLTLASLAKTFPVF